MGCSDKIYSFLKSYDGGIEPERLGLQMDVEPFNLREDIIRNTEAIEDKVNKKPYYPLGFHICNGIFLDLNGNLSFDIAELFNITKVSRFKVVEKTNLLFNNEMFTVKKEDNKIKRERKSFLNKDVENIEFKGDTISIKENGLFSQDMTICFNPKKLVYDSPSIFFNLYGSIIKESDHSFITQYRTFDNRIEQINNNLIISDKKRKITRLANMIEFEFPGIKKFSVIRINDGYIYQTGYNVLERIKIEPDKIEVYENNKLCKSFILVINPH